MEMADSDGKSGTTVSTGALRERSWTHLAIVVDRPSRKVSYFFNGKLDSVCEIPPDFTGDLNVAGKPLSTGTWQPFVGLIHDLRIYRRILVDGEPASDFDDTKSRHASNSFKVLIED